MLLKERPNWLLHSCNEPWKHDSDLAELAKFQKLTAREQLRQNVWSMVKEMAENHDQQSGEKSLYICSDINILKTQIVTELRKKKKTF